ncbi:ABC transporter ATP-binding protein [Noviherbaspirillum denitrificans]|uniref:ABC transporter ATP-binding protein n=1 Tax=Noviherbaspirillum denitrificans TaxID=1968433 RepID=A0A254TGL3_9BURK|nr:ABC transporter ATP-binding protein [Noviherbaspirillum denitrificans]OWW21799.1 ABC transporter ATP-binding protein [Noviherbaspirillum denitrificans]
MSTPRIALDGIRKSFPAPRGRQEKTTVLSDISLTLAEGEFVCLLGPSGCGKSTVLGMAAGFDQPDSGILLHDGEPIAGPSPQRGMVFQQPTLFPWLSVLDNVTFGPRMAGVPRERYLAEAERYLRLVGLQGFEHHATWQLSGGMRQRAALARAWMPNPEVLLMDEPFGALDAQTRLMMQELLTSVWQATGTSILFVTHDVDEALFLADRVLVMSARPGTIREELRVPFERPRSIESLVTDPEYARLKQRILHIVREEAGKSMLAENGLCPA